MRKPRAESESKIYHVVQRGNSHQHIFEDDHDRQHYLRDIKRFSGKHDVSILGWCLMDNHVHLLLEGELSSLSGFMRDLGSDYAQYFNDRYDCVSHLFQGRYLSEPVNTDEYLLAAIRYIHNNPSNAGLAAAWSYRWSSYFEYTHHANLCKVERILELLDGVDGFLAFHRSPASEQSGYLFLDDTSIRHSDDISLTEFAISIIGETTYRNIKTLPKLERKGALSKLRQSGLSIRQIERITGIGRGIISRSVT